MILRKIPSRLHRQPGADGEEQDGQCRADAGQDHGQHKDGEVALLVGETADVQGSDHIAVVGQGVQGAGGDGGHTVNGLGDHALGDIDGGDGGDCHANAAGGGPRDAADQGDGEGHAHQSRAGDLVNVFGQPSEGRSALDHRADNIGTLTGTAEQAEEILAFGGFKLGINGIVTFRNSTLPAVLPHIDLRHIVLETDAPYLTPVPFRGKRNESAYVQHVCRKVAEIYGLSEAETDARTTQNACELFGLESAGKGISL